MIQSAFPPLEQDLETINDRLGGLEEKLTQSVNIGSYLAFVGNVNADQLDAAFGKCNEDKIHNIGLQLAMYAWYKGDSKVANPFTKLLSCDTFLDCTKYAMPEILENENIFNLVSLSPYAENLISTGYGAMNALIWNYEITGNYNTILDLLGSDIALAKIASTTPKVKNLYFINLISKYNDEITETLSKSLKFTYSVIAYDNNKFEPVPKEYQPSNSFIHLISIVNRNAQLEFEITLNYIYSNTILTHAHMNKNSTIAVNSPLVIGGVVSTAKIYTNNATVLNFGVYSLK